VEGEGEEMVGRDEVVGHEPEDEDPEEGQECPFEGPERMGRGGHARHQGKKRIGLTTNDGLRPRVPHGRGTEGSQGPRRGAGEPPPTPSARLRERRIYTPPSFATEGNEEHLSRRTGDETCDRLTPRPVPPDPKCAWPRRSSPG
jgi:hypothetical protein